MQNIEISGLKLRNADYITISDDSHGKISSLLCVKHKEDPTILGILITLNQKGCAGLAYKIEYAKANINIFDGFEVIRNKTFDIFINPKISLYLIGTKMQYKSDALESGFFFENPNSKGSCGCGESFFV